MLYNLRLAVAVSKCGVSPAPQWRSVVCNLLWPCSPIETSDSVKWDSPIAKGLLGRAARRQKIRLLFGNKSLSVECLCCYISDCKATGRFHKKTRIRFILIRMYKKTKLLLL